MRSATTEPVGGRQAFGELTSGAIAAAAALRVRGRPEDLALAAFLERLSGAARMCLAGETSQLDMFDAPADGRCSSESTTEASK